MERPQEIKRFAIMGGIARLINLAATLLTLHLGLQAVAGALVGAFIILGLILWVMIGRSGVGRLITTIWLTFATGSTIGSYILLLQHHRVGLMSPPAHILSLITIVVNCGALYFLWAETSTVWLQKGADISDRP